MAKSKKYIVFGIFLLIGILMLATFLGCSGTTISSKDTTKIMDSYKREVRVPTDVQRVATVGCATRLVVYAGAVDKLVAITEMDRPSELRPYTIAYEEEFKNLPTTNNGNHLNSTTIDEEKMLEIKPDVIISSRSADECEKLQEHIKIPVIGIDAQGDLLDDQYASSIQIVGLACGTSEHANQLIGYARGIYNELYNVSKPTSPRVYRGAINYKGSKDLTGTYSEFNVYKTISATNVADNPNIKGAYDTTLEQILAWDPEYIFMDYSNKEKVAQQIERQPQAFKRLQAFKNNNVYFCAPFNNNGTNAEYSLCECYLTAKIIYPQIFSYVNLDQKFAEIINHHLGKDIYQELVARGVYFGPAQF